MPSPQIIMELRRIGEYLPCGMVDIDWALSVQAQESASGNVRRIGEILIEREEISYENLVQALDQQRLDRLRGCSLLADTTEEELQAIAEHCEEITLESGENLFTEGRRGDSIYIVLSGRILLWRGGEIQNEIPVGAALRGDVLGENDYFRSGTRCCSACATEPSVLFKIRYDLLPRRMRCCAKNLSLELPAEGPADELVPQILERVMRLLRADRAYLFYRDFETGEFHVTLGEGENAEKISIPAGTDIIGWVALKRKIVNVPEAYSDVRFDPSVDIWSSYWTRTLLAAPVFNAQGEVIAVLEAVNKEDGFFDSDDEALLHAFSRQSAVAIDYCRTAALAPPRSSDGD